MQRTLSDQTIRAGSPFDGPGQAVGPASGEPVREGPGQVSAKPEDRGSAPGSTLLGFLEMSHREPAPVVGIIGGSGIHNLDGLTDPRWEKISSPFGEPSNELLFGELDGQRLVFLPRHDRGQRIPPSELNFRANIDALKRAGCTEIISINAVGSLREDLSPGIFVIVDQFIDRTFAREQTFFGIGMVAHVALAHPVCSRLGDHLEAAGRDLGIPMVRGGTYLVMEGPQFSTLAESRCYRSWGCDVIGMTNMPEARLAREAEMCYASVAMVTDYDCWHPDHEHVTAKAVAEMLADNAEKGRRLVRHVLPRLGNRDGPCPEGCHRALDRALISAPEARDADLLKKLVAVAGRVLRATGPEQEERPRGVD